MKAWNNHGGRGRPGAVRPGRDHGTPELQARRTSLAAGADPAMTEYPLGLLLARAVVDRAQHDSGCQYAYLYQRAVGRTHLSCAFLYRAIMGEHGFYPEPPDEAAQARLERLYRTGKNRLLAAGRRICDATENVVVFQRTPAALDGPRRRMNRLLQENSGELANVLAGLDVLVACYGRASRAAGRMDAHCPPSLRQSAPSILVDNRRNIII
jgi:hypothetical protein